jgi:hypothetical protein
VILPNIRAGFDRREAAYLIWLLTRGEEAASEREQRRLQEEGLDAILDDPRTLNAVMAGSEFSTAPAPLVFYLLVRHSLLEDGIEERALADYIAALLLAFGRTGHALGTEGGEPELRYLVDIVAAADAASGEEAFRLRAHLGEFALWLCGLFPDHITSRVHKRGAPGLRYYEELGSTGYRMAADHVIAERYGISVLYRNCAASFPALRVALNRVADRHFFPARGDAVDRLLRQVRDRFQSN